MRTIILFLILNSMTCSYSQTDATDYAALMSFKSHLTIQHNNTLLKNWNSSTHFCNWHGVSCLNQRVTSLRLSGLNLQGELSPDIANMTHLTELDLSSNKLRGNLPSEIGFLQQLRILNLTQNSITGNIPLNLSYCKGLQELDLSFNFFEGIIPDELGLLSNLKFLALSHNNLTGKIPVSLGNFSKLEYLYLNDNDLVDQIPAEFGKLEALTSLALRGNNLTGSLPSSIFNISGLQIVDLSINGLSGELPYLGIRLPNLQRLFVDSNRISGKIPTSLSNSTKLNYLYLTENDLHGEIPDGFGRLRDLIWFEFEYNQISGGIPYEMFNITSLEVLKARKNYLSGELPHDLGEHLPNLHDLFLSHNQFSGGLPSSICNSTNLVYLEISNNSFSGPVPMLLGNLVKLEHLNLQVNQLTNKPGSTYLDFLDSLVNSVNLQFLILDSNPLNGILPESIGNLSSSLKVFTAISCELKGDIPQGFGNLSNVFYLGLSNNNLQGSIPSSFISMQSLERMYLTGNELQGNVPPVVCSMNTLGILHLGENKFSGSVPECIQNLTQLREFSLADNELNSTVPSGFWGLVLLQGLNLSRNSLQGSLPAEISNLKDADIIDLSCNEFSGEIPDSLGQLQKLFTLDMSHNKFQGPIPNTFSSFIVIEYLDLSSNALSGNIPSSLGLLRDLQYLNLSFNMLEGEVPHGGVFENITYEFLMGNSGLCGSSSLNLSTCTPQTSRGKNRRKRLLLKILIPIAAIILFTVFCFLAWIALLSRKKREAKTTRSDSIRVGYQIVTYYQLLQATESFNESNLVGKGSSGMVYKGTFPNGTLAAVKVFSVQYSAALKNFEVECEVLSNVRHRNLVKVISACSNEEFKAMVLEFMPNGNLDKWLHTQSSLLSFVQRLDIVIDVAMAMEYLHHEYTVPIVHCDLKPSNVLLDEDMTAHVADFGIAKILGEDEEFIRTRTLGTIGYLAPEYGLHGHVSTKGDVYSFGIILLETFTGKRPTDSMFGEDLSLHQWVSGSYPHTLREVLDPNIIYSDINLVKEKSSRTKTPENENLIEELLESIIHVALLCANESPEERMDMRSVVSRLKKIRSQLITSEKPHTIRASTAVLDS